MVDWPKLFPLAYDTARGLDARGLPRQVLRGAMDAAVTYEVARTLLPKVEADARVAAVYAFERALQGPAMAMELRGLRVDEGRRVAAIEQLRADARRQQKRVDEIVRQARSERAAVTAQELAQAQAALTEAQAERLRKIERRERLGDTARAIRQWTKWVRELGLKLREARGFRYAKSLAPSTQQLQVLLYVDMGLPVQTSQTGEPSANVEALERLGRRYPKVAELCELVLTLRGLQKQTEVLESGLSPDGRLRGSFSVGQTETGRWSGTKDVYGLGTNLQNVNKQVRWAVVADPGWRLVQVDLRQADSIALSHLAGDERGIRDHVEGNAHVRLARELWPGAAWTGNDVEDEAVAKTGGQYQAAKRVRHGLGYGMTYRGLARQLHCPEAEALEHYQAFHGRYPRIAEFHRGLEQMLRDGGEWTSPLGRKRQFFGRHWSRSVLKEAVANGPQGMVADILDIGLLRVWRSWDPERVRVHQQGHDSVLYQVREGDEEILGLLAAAHRVPVRVGEREMVVGVAVETGRSWEELG